MIFLLEKLIMEQGKSISISQTKKFVAASKIMDSKGFTLREYQATGVKWMIGQEFKRENPGGILADDPGLGKTIQTVALMVAIPKKTLIIVPTAVLTQWNNIMTQIFGEETIYVHYGTEKKNTSREIAELDFTICITSHGCAVSRKKKCYTTPLHISDFWGRIIIDEGHVIRNKKTKMYQTVINYSCDNCAKWILSGTPIQNRRGDIINILSFIGIPRSAIKANLEKYIHKYLLRRTKKVLLDGIFKEIDFNTHIIPFKTRKEQNIYNKIEMASLEELADIKYSGGSSLNYEMMLLEVMIRLRQASCHPQIAIDSMNSKYEDVDIDDFRDTSTKMNAIVNDISITEGLSLVFCHFIGEMNIIQEQLKIQNIASELYHGSMSRSQRDYTLTRFKNGTTSSKVLIIQIMAGGVGLNLQEFSNVFISSPDWNPTNEIQAISRAHRYGQTKTVTVHKYILTYNSDFISPDNEDIDMDSNTIDERILKLQIMKRNIMVNLLKDDTLKFNEKFKLNKSLEKDYESIVSQYYL